MTVAELEKKLDAPEYPMSIEELQHLCAACHDEVGQILIPDEEVYVCPTCARNLGFRCCECCGTLTRKTVVIDDYPYYVCSEECEAAHTDGCHVCERCGQYTDEPITRFVGDESLSICEHCE